MIGGPQDRWRLTETVLPFPGRRLPRGVEGTGRLVRVLARSEVDAVFAGRGLAGGAGFVLPFVARFDGEAQLEGGRLRVTVYASALSMILVGALAGVFFLAGVRLFVGHPGLGTALVGAGLAGLGAWLLGQIQKAGRDVARDAADVLEAMARPRPPGVTESAAGETP